MTIKSPMSSVLEIGEEMAEVCCNGVSTQC